LVPALTYAGRDGKRQALDEDDVAFIQDMLRTLLDTIQESRQELQALNKSANPDQRIRPDVGAVTILGIPAHDRGDEVALMMLGQMLEGENCVLKSAGSEMLVSEVLALVEETRPAAVCIAAVPPGGLARARFLCKRVRERYPELRLIVGRWGLTSADEDHENALRAAGADNVRTTLVATRNDIIAWLPAFNEKRAGVVA
jgi:hypothetical protein